MEISLSIWSVIGLAIGYGFTMKLADLLDEHGLKLFPGADILFGLLWGAFGSVLIMSDMILANILLAQMIAYVVRRRLDYLNHALGATLMILIFLIYQDFQLFVFGVFGATFIVFGALRDYIGNVRQQRDWVYYLNEPAWYYVIPPAIYSLATGEWLVFFALTAYRLSYNLVKYGAPRLVKTIDA